MLGTVRAVIALGSFAWAAALGALGRNGFAIPRPRPAFGHGAEAVLRRSSGSAIRLIGCYHPSQQNTFTGNAPADARRHPAPGNRLTAL